MTTTSPGVRGPYAKTVQVKQRILDASIEVFAATGYHATTMKEIAERAGISERGLAHHFPSKSELLVALLERREAANARQVPSVAGLEALLGMLEIVAADSAQPNLVELHSLLSAEAASPEHPAHDHYRYRYDMFRRFAVQSFAALRREGQLESPLSDAELGAAYVALSDGLQLQWLYHRDAIDSAAILRHFLESVIPQLAALARKR
jgi:AcrR family transcriptional regulator